MQVRVQGKRVERALDVQAAAGGVNRSLVREYRNVVAGEALVIELKSARPGDDTLLSGIELIDEGTAAANANARQR